MDQTELVILIAAIIGLAILMKLWKQIIAVIIIGAIFFFIYASNKIPSIHTPITPAPGKQPIREPRIPADLPDLRVRIDGSTSHGFSCNEQSLSVFVWNTGRGAARNIEVVNNSPRINWHINTLQAGEGVKRSFPLKVDNWRQGKGLISFNVQLAVDPYQRISETEKANNYSNVVEFRCY